MAVAGGRGKAGSGLVVELDPAAPPSVVSTPASSPPVGSSPSLVMGSADGKPAGDTAVVAGAVPVSDEEGEPTYPSQSSDTSSPVAKVVPASSAPPGVEGLSFVVARAEAGLARRFFLEPGVRGCAGLGDAFTADTLGAATRLRGVALASMRRRRRTGRCRRKCRPAWFSGRIAACSREAAAARYRPKKYSRYSYVGSDFVQTWNLKLERTITTYIVRAGT